MADAMIRVPAHVRDRLAVLAEAQDTSIRSLIQDFAESTFTQEELDASAERAKTYLSTYLGVDVTPAEEEAIQRKMDALEAADAVACADDTEAAEKPADAPSTPPDAAAA
ncbi:hypothetical protein [Streptomyces sp. Z26]|uniref:hypothetical protein n=1 Tax=Streptomyces sp. Z26 TaxID=2500177 RepID=UPI000EF16D92|nr:hypothetical protein [Streptomyces sp. Z26]RLL67125.1 hypothetical protein D7M15_09890 [Streptomyces sp. Z26]